MADLSCLVTNEVLHIATLNQGVVQLIGVLHIQDGPVSAALVTTNLNANLTETLRLSDTDADNWVEFNADEGLRLADGPVVTVMDGGSLITAVLSETLHLSEQSVTGRRNPDAIVCGPELLSIRDLVSAAIAVVSTPSTFRVEMQFTPSIWATNTDVIASQPMHWQRGQTSQPSPADRTPAPGSFEFSLRNDAGNSAKKLGYYSPHHVNCRPGFTFGIPVRVVATISGTDYILWTGKLRSIDPEPGLHRTRRTNCVAQDAIADLVEADVRSIPPQVGQSEVSLIAVVVSALASEAQPPATSFASALDTYPYAFDDIAGGVKAIGAINDVAVSALGFVYLRGDGTLVYEDRHTRSLKPSVYTLDLDANGVGFVAPSTLTGLYNRVRITTHPKTIDDLPETVLFATTGSTAVAPMQDVEVWGDYRDPTNTVKLIGGTEAITALVPNTDYVANSTSDGTGTDVTAGVTIAATAFAASVKFVVSNSSAQTAYLTTLQIRGKGVYDDAPQTFEAFAAEDYGDRPLDLDLRYLADANVAQDMADYLLVTYANRTMIDEVTLIGNKSSTLMLQIVTREIGDVVTISETVTGVSAVDVVILGIAIEIQPGNIVRCTWSVGPHASTAAMVLDDAVRGVLNSAQAVLGYA